MAIETFIMGVARLTGGGIVTKESLHPLRLDGHRPCLVLQVLLDGSSSLGSLLDQLLVGLRVQRIQHSVKEVSLRVALAITLQVREIS